MAKRPQEPILLYGIGATKAGTSWVHRYLSSHPQCHFRSIKELHYFNSLDNQTAGWRRKALEKDIVRLRADYDVSAQSRKMLINRRTYDIESWFRVFERLDPTHHEYLAYLVEGCGDAKVIGDITPAYSILSEERYAEMAALTHRTRFLYILRDPVDRLWSNVRMAARKARRLDGTFAEKSAKILDRFLEGEHEPISKRSDYSATLTRLTNSVPLEHIMVEFFENLFTTRAVDRLTDFLGVASHKAPLDKIVHKGAPAEMDNERYKRALKVLEPQYRFVNDFFAGQVPPRWQTHMAEA